MNSRASAIRTCLPAPEVHPLQRRMPSCALTVRSTFGGTMLERLRELPPDNPDCLLSLKHKAGGSPWVPAAEGGSLSLKPPTTRILSQYPWDVLSIPEPSTGYEQEDLPHAKVLPDEDANPWAVRTRTRQDPCGTGTRQ